MEIENLEIKGNTCQERGNVTDEEGNVIGARPSIEIPSEIERVTGNVEIGVGGKNLFNEKSYTWIKAYLTTTGGHWGSSAGLWSLSITDYIKVKPNTNYKISAKLGKMATSYDGIMVSLYQVNKSHIKRLSIQSNNVFTTTEDTAYMRIAFYSFKDSNGNNVVTDLSNISDYIYDIQIEEGTEGTEYVPYEGGNYPILLGDMELYGNDTVRDNICKENGKWYIERNWNKVILDGVNYKFTYKHGTIQTDTQGFFASAFENKDNVHTSGSTDFAFCNCLKLKDGGPSSAIYEDCIWWEGNSNNIYFSLPYTTLADANAWLQEKYGSGNPVEVIYKIANSKKEEITDETLIAQLENLINAKTCKEITHVDSVTDNIRPILSFCYRKDLQIENDRIKARLDEIEALLSATATSALLLNNLENDLKGEVM